ncbi:MAG TPA: hypothetical protein VD999_00530 [Vitreimonas sp.]|nr:hypothetical protein [Vitreimonas sp.]
MPQETLGPLTEGKLIGHLIRGTERAPIRFADLPEHIDLSGILLKRAQYIWEVSSEDPQLREHALNGVTKYDRKLHLDKTPIVGNVESVVIFTPAVGVSGRVLSIHSHAILDTPPSGVDIANLLRGSQGYQGMWITTASADFFIVRTDQTPIYANTETLLEKAEDYESGRHLLTSQRQSQSFYETVKNQVENNSLDGDHLSSLHNQQLIVKNTLAASFSLTFCTKHSIGFYYSPKSGLFTRVTHVDQLANYITPLKNLIGDDIEHLKRKRQLELNPELRKVKVESLSPAFTIAMWEKIKNYIGSDVAKPFFPDGVEPIIEAYNTYHQLQLTETEFLALVLEKNDYNPDQNNETFSPIHGFLMIAQELGLLKEN